MFWIILLLLVGFGVVVWAIIEWTEPRDNQSDSLVDERYEMRMQGHSEEFIRIQQRLRTLRAEHKMHKAGPIVALILGIVFLFVFPPIGIAVLCFYVFMVLKTMLLESKAARSTAAEIAALEAQLPER